MTDALLHSPPIRPEYERTVSMPATIGNVERPLALAERVWNVPLVRKIVILAALAAIWEIYARYAANPLMFPTFSDTLRAWWDGVVSGVIGQRLLVTLQILVMGYAIGLALAAVFVSIAISSRLGTDLLSSLTAMLNVRG